MPNVFEPEWQGERAGCRINMVGVAAGAKRLGASVVEVAPASLSSPYHVHHGNEELLIVLSGTPELRTPHGHRQLTPGEVVSFPRGPEGGHRLRNTSSEPCRLFFVSEMNLPDVVEYPDTGVTLTVTGPDARQAFPRACDQPLPDLVAAALDADQGSARP
jgi:uncharacterized cupin superfamily protein